MEHTNEENRNGVPATIYSKLVAQSTQRFFSSTELADVYFVFENEQVRIPAHKSILAMISPVFQTMFFGSMPEEGDINIIDSSSSAFKQFLSTFYCAEIGITAEHIAKVMYLAKKYLVAGCLEICDQFLQGFETIDDVIDGYGLAVAFDRVDLKKTLEEKISEQPQSVIESSAWLNFSPEVLKEFLQIDGLMGKAKKLFDVSMKWAQNACNIFGLDSSDMQNRKKQLGECFYWIPFYMMKPTQIVQIATEDKDLFDRDELIDLLRIAVSVGPVQTKIFKSKTKFAPKAEIGTGKQECTGCWVQRLPEEDKIWIKKKESKFATISANTKIVRKTDIVAIRPPIIFHNENVATKILCGTLTISRNDGISLKQPIAIQCIKSPLYSITERIKLIRPFEMTPGKILFEINFDSSWESNKFFTKKINDEELDLFQFLYLS